MLSHHYAGMYVAVVALIVVGAVLSFALWVQQRRVARIPRSPAPRSRWSESSDEPHA